MNSIESVLFDLDDLPNLERYISTGCWFAMVDPIGLVEKGFILFDYFNLP